MREANIGPSLRASYTAMHDTCRKRCGLADCLLAKLLARAVLRLA
jgi:hypothetical protein